ncbi:hypothetical protein BT96DRAFT_936233 [Gymnopus androsaceus JB14]|uniref:Uncharacterized protein n=1 Tax=Gymnopus androsaceus JB14 TaxID=1447944 RepID=A0A6A4HWB8_9AGAR|nr:hypothetical protein BT96DRAFT_936233 [Gymnopus androsaceus JB14]
MMEWQVEMCAQHRQKVLDELEAEMNQIVLPTKLLAYHSAVAYLQAMQIIKACCLQETQEAREVRRIRCCLHQSSPPVSAAIPVPSLYLELTSFLLIVPAQPMRTLNGTTHIPAENTQVWENLCNEWMNAPIPKGRSLLILLASLKTVFKVKFCDNDANQVLFAALRSKRRSILQNLLLRFQEQQSIYMPGLQRYLIDSNKPLTSSEVGPEQAKLWLPSAYVQYPAVATEKKLRQYRCFESLDALRYYLRLRTRLIRNQLPTTRSHQALSSVLERASNTAQRAALLELRGPGEWEKQLRVLRDEDASSVDPSFVSQEVQMNTETVDGVVPVQQVSWIWRTDVMGTEADEILRAEWCRSWAHVQKSKNEMELLREEFREALCKAQIKDDIGYLRKTSSIECILIRLNCTYMSVSRSVMQRGLMGSTQCILLANLVLWIVAITLSSIFQDKYAPDHAKRDYTYEEHREEVIQEGWAPNMIEEIIRGRIIYGREYYQCNKDLLLTRTSVYWVT